jgi:hypothetical protein
MTGTDTGTGRLSGVSAANARPGFESRRGNLAATGKEVKEE